MAAKKKVVPPTTATPVAPVALPLTPREIDARTFALGRAWWALIACERGQAVVTSRLDGATAAVDVRAWPPSVHAIAADWTRSSARSRQGAWAHLVGWAQQRILVFPPGETTPIEIPMPKKKLGFAAVAFVGERVVAIPGPLGHDNKSSPLTCAASLMIESGGVLVPAASEVSEGGVAYDACGGVALEDGSDLVVWSGRVLAWNGDRFVRYAPDLPRSHHSFGFSTAPFGDGFFCTTGEELLLVRRGAGPHEHHAPQLTGVVAVARDGDGVVVTSLPPIAHHRYRPRSGSLERLDTSAFEDLDARVFASPVGLVANAKQRAEIVRIAP